MIWGAQVAVLSLAINQLYLLQNSAVSRMRTKLWIQNANWENRNMVKVQLGNEGLRRMRMLMKRRNMMTLGINMRRMRRNMINMRRNMMRRNVWRNMRSRKRRWSDQDKHVEGKLAGLAGLGLTHLATVVTRPDLASLSNFCRRVFSNWWADALKSQEALKSLEAFAR